jgi:hypothetical protein
VRVLYTFPWFHFITVIFKINLFFNLEGWPDTGIDGKVLNSNKV